MDIGQKVIVGEGDDNEFQAVYVGSVVYQRVRGGPMETAALVRLNPADSGYVHPSGKQRKPFAYVDFLVVHPDNITEDAGGEFGRAASRKASHKSRGR